MEIKGKILAIEQVKVISDKFSIQEFVIETQGQYPKKLALQAINKCQYDLVRMGIGSSGTFTFDAESKEFNGKWYTNLRCNAIKED
jgi:hypothetical protein